MRNLNIVFGRILCSVMQTFCLLSAIVFFLSSCKQPDTIQQEELLGRWEITKAERNGKETSYLRRGYFHIEQSTMTINITGADEKGTYTMNKNKLVMGEKNFELETVKGDTMIVTYSAGPNSEFVFHMLKKRKDDVQ